jgi:hypothetical protein
MSSYYKVWYATLHGRYTTGHCLNCYIFETETPRHARRLHTSRRLLVRRSLKHDSTFIEPRKEPTEDGGEERRGEGEKEGKGDCI